MIGRNQQLPEPKTMSIRLPLWKGALLLCFLGGACLFAFRLIGSPIDQDGVLHEPFPLIPIGWLLISLGVVAGVVHVVRAGARYMSARHK
jgi:hypothetical protein